MPLPSWNDPELKAGTMVRCALWLVHEVGEGNTFTKEQLREAFPGVSQADRRARELRKYGWLLTTNTEDASLTAEEQRFEKAGVPIWDQAARSAAAPKKAVSAKERQATLARDGYLCTVCGISAGEPYPEDSNQTAVLSVSRRDLALPGAQPQTVLTTECKWCRVGSGIAAVDATVVVAEIKSLDTASKRQLLQWVVQDGRKPTLLERAWAAYCHLPARARDEVRTLLEGSRV
ncbi:hypothetical protein AB0I28_09585 [Phytomonospora sp. NPDC050363]|uniref:hypothetical protein n=1 Tax=Phytomonospora sp. NPDC050363 TaxID=3155642 RepID=UPI0033DEFBA3